MVAVITTKHAPLKGSGGMLPEKKIGAIRWHFLQKLCQLKSFSYDIGTMNPSAI